MAFLPNDLYLASGTSTLINSWTDPVYKFDSSSFYNWEQDNLPIYDLEGRDDYLYEMAGYPASAIDGFMLTVSDCGIDYKRVFPTISTALDALPKKIRFPVIIEVCTSGQLGGLHLESRDFEGSSAGIEIINRGFAKILAGSGATVNDLSSKVYGVLNSSSIGSFSSLDVSNTMLNSQSLGVSDHVWINNPGATNTLKAYNWWNNFTRTFVQIPEWGYFDTTYSTRTISISNRFGDSNTGWIRSGIPAFDVSNYADNSLSSDIAITSNGTGDTLQRDDGDFAVNFRNTGFVYANALSGVSVKDCAGKVYIRGFCVDGADKWEVSNTGVQRTDTGFDIQNSEVLLENCVAARCRNAGMQAVNSNVTLNRGFIAFHNYELKTSPNYLDTKVSGNPTPGLRAINSNITLSASPDVTKSLPVDSPFSFYRNMVGIELQNSELVTPPECRGGVAGATDIVGTEDVTNTLGTQEMVLQTFFNVNEGIKAKNSLIETGYRLAAFQNKVGIKLENSTCKLGEVTIDHNNEAGLLAHESIFNYNKDGRNIGWTAGPFYPVNNFQSNGQHVVLKASEFIPTEVSGMQSKYTRLDFSGTNQVVLQGGQQNNLPSIVVDKGSYMKAISSRTIVNTAFESQGNPTSYRADSSIKGSAFRVTNHSTLDLFGGGANSNIVLGPQLWSKQQKTAGLYAGNNSKIYIAGPTTIVQFGVDALAEDNSVIEIGPHHKDGIIDPSGWDLTASLGYNQTKVQLHATRACLVANKNSTINIHDIGDYHGRWAGKYLTKPDYPTGDEATSGYQTSAYCSSGDVRFYPNPFVNYTTNDLISQSNWPTTAGNTYAFNAPLDEYTPMQTDWEVSTLSYGGMCVRAVENSQVNVKNVNLAATWKNTSGAYYDFSGTTVGGATNACNLLRIWNIADNSELRTAYISVNGVHPQDVSGDYYGPSAMWASAIEGAYSGAPSSTPDTSSLSVLDTFGRGWNAGDPVGTYGASYAENIGPFRLYVSPSPKAKFLGYPYDSAGRPFIPYTGNYPVGIVSSMGYNFDEAATLKQGAPYQIIAQGYNPSGDCSAINNQGPNYTNVSAIYQDLGFSAYGNKLPAAVQAVPNVASSFYYAADMLPYDNEHRILLDESGMNTFANAKNGTLGTSGRKKICSFYQSTIKYPGEAFIGEDAGHGLGFGSANLFDLDREL